MDEFNSCADLFLRMKMAPAIEAALEKVASLVGADVDNLTFIENASTGINTVLKNMELVSGGI